MSEHHEADVKFAVRTLGQGDATFLVVNGGPGLSSSYMLPGLSFLADEYKCVFYDQPGCGDDHTDPATVTADSTADHFADLLTELSPDRKITVLSHSWGSHVLFRGLSRHPNISRHIAKAILLNPTPTAAAEYGEVADTLQSRVRASDMARIVELMKSTKTSAGNEIMEIALTAYTGSTQRHPSLDFDYSLTVFNSVNSTIGNFDFNDLLDRNLFDIYVVGGSDDYIMPSNLRELLSAARESEFIPNAGHFAFAEAPVPFQKAVRQFASYS